MARNNSNGNNAGALGFEATLWATADKLRGNLDAAEYKHVVLGLIFLKYISDAFEERHAALAKDKSADPEDRDEYTADNIFWVNKIARWSYLQGRAKQPTISVIEELLSDLGLTGSKFDRVIADKREFIAGTEAKKFHQGLEFLGKMIGAITHQWNGDGKPDGFWNITFWRAFVFEAKTDEITDAPITLASVRQALTHAKCVRDDRLLPTHTSLQTVVISPRSTIDGEARKHAGNLLYCSHDQIVGLFDRAAAALTELRTIATRTLQEELPDEALKIYAKHQALPDAVASLLTGVNLVNMQTQAEARAKVEKK